MKIEFKKNGAIKEMIVPDTISSDELKELIYPKINLDLLNRPFIITVWPAKYFLTKAPN
jgi:hypothetical protein